MKSAADRFIGAARDAGIDFFCGVPCTYLAPLLSVIERQNLLYWPATREDAACGTAVGAYLAGARPCLLIQNSGFANAINAIASLLVPFKIPALLITSWRGEPGLDSPEHDVLGTAFPDLVRSLKLEMLMLDTEIERTVQNAAAISFSKLCPTVIAITKGALDEPR